MQSCSCSFMSHESCGLPGASTARKMVTLKIVSILAWYTSECDPFRPLFADPKLAPEVNHLEATKGGMVWHKQLKAMAKSPCAGCLCADSTSHGRHASWSSSPTALLQAVSFSLPDPYILSSQRFKGTPEAGPETGSSLLLLA